MIRQLDNSNKALAQQIFTVFQRSYKIEAQLIGTLNFPPLLRQVEDIAKATTVFYGYFENDCLAAVIEIALDEDLNINSLTVDPNFFRKGIAGNLINFVLTECRFVKAFVETAVVNAPAINLYKRHGFIELKRWTPSHGIEKLRMSRL